MVSVDGQQAMLLGPDDIVELCQGANPVLLVRFQTDYFARMRASLRWGDLAERETLP
jgi:NAD kinase